MTVGNKKLSETQATFYPPSLIPPFMGCMPPSKKSASLYEAGSINYFQNYRNDTLSKFSMPPYKWGMRNIPYSLKTNLMTSAMRRNINRELTVTWNDVSTIDPARMSEVDNLFKVVQIHRGQYKDRTGSCHPLAFFKPDKYEYQCAPDMTASYFTKYPQNYIKYKTPTVLPLTYERRKQSPYIPDLSLTGIYNEASCIAYKR